MKKIIVLISICLLLTPSLYQAQVLVPKPSPATKMQQTVGLTDITIEYSRPSKKDRALFGDLVPYDKVWRAGANKNTTITFSDDIKFGDKQVGKGTYAIYIKPSESSWEIILYSDTENWGVPKDWDDTKVVTKVTSEVKHSSDGTESFLIVFDNLRDNHADLYFIWNDVYASVRIEVDTHEKTMSSIQKTLGGDKATADDYYVAASYYNDTDKDNGQAKEWIDKASELKADKPFWYSSLQSEIYAKSGDTKNAKKFIKEAIKKAEEMGYNQYVDELKVALENL